ncbi:hypothetical protein UFOVP706_24 [uncultured Caudovirales phage]|jgi:hypothetical protein|uniref:Uncharacterized protein n=1 Tax=uncultured Caudovirales phage TaxID=2100421 RepID=A0A6J5NG15_9CAUD|nr:hypothetical protein UFOVP706_24 [uncultured Caudovirales phage]
MNDTFKTIIEAIALLGFVAGVFVWLIGTR